VHLVPSQHFPSSQSQTFTSWLFSKEHPHAPTKQVFGKPSADLQQVIVVTSPPESVHAFSNSDFLG
jgi:hypothetical protein